MSDKDPVMDRPHPETPRAIYPNIQGFIDSLLNGIAVRTTSEPVSPAPDSLTNTEPQNNGIQGEVAHILDQLRPCPDYDARLKALVEICKAYSAVRSRLNPAKRRAEVLLSEIDAHTERLGAYCECFAVANGRVAEQDSIIAHLADEIVDCHDCCDEEELHIWTRIEEAQEKLQWLAGDCGLMLSKVYAETNRLKGKKAEMRLCEAKLRRYEAKARDYKEHAMAIAQGQGPTVDLAREMAEIELCRRN